MRILVANLGSTSFKCRLFAASGEELTALGKASVERVEDYGAAIAEGLRQLREGGGLREGETPEAVGFKTVLGHNLSGCVTADEECLRALREAIPLAPAHNPPYIAGIEQFARDLPGVPRVALFETAFYQWMPPEARVYAVPDSWRRAGVVRHGFHGASHKFVAERSAALLHREDVAERVRRLYSSGPETPLEPGAPPLRVISCHLGGSSSVTAIRNGVAIGTSMGLSPQSGLPQNNRVGDLDSMAIPLVCRELGLSIEEAVAQLSTQSGLLGLSGVSNDIRDIRAAAEAGNEKARLALNHFVHQVRHWIGAFWIALGGCDAIVFTAGIGENNPELRSAILADLAGLGVVVDPEANVASGAGERSFAAPASKAALWIIPANEERVVAMETFRHLQVADPERAGTSLSR